MFEVVDTQEAERFVAFLQFVCLCYLRDYSLEDVEADYRGEKLNGASGCLYRATASHE